MARTDAADVVRSYHSATTHGGDHDRSQLIHFRPLDPTNRPEPFKRYPGVPIERLADDDYLYFTAGVTRVSHTSYFRAAMSAGNLHPVELYTVGEDLGVRHYEPLENGTTALRPGNGPPAWIVLTGIPWRTAWKYGERGWRHLYWDSGAMAANFLALFPRAVADLQFDDAAVCHLLGIDDRNEIPLAVIRLGPAELPVVADLPPLDVDVTPFAPRPIEFPLITTVQRATSQVRGRLPVCSAETSPNLGSLSMQELILRRGSTRLFRHERVAESALREPMRLATEGAPLIEHYISAHSVDGVTNHPREIAQHLTYDQPLGGDSAYTVFHSADLEKVLEEYGARGYRAALFEAGFAAERLELAAFSIGLGATGLTFYDDEVKAAFDTDSACMLVTAVGVPDYRSRPGGKPRDPTRLTGFDDLMGRLQVRMMQSRT